MMKREWYWHGAALALLLLLTAAVFYPTFASIVGIWGRSDTFAHGYLIVPIVLWLMWRIRHEILATTPKANVLALPLLLLLCLMWLLAIYTGVLVMEQLVVVSMIPLLFFATLGWQTTRKMVFPLGFLLFAVPMGEELTPKLINFTADFTVAMIELVGIPIYREGTFFQLPTGSWSVVAACSGVRYLIASLTLGVLYAYLNYQSLTKRLIFVAFSIVVPIIANGLRAFMIVMIGHFSEMKYAVGVDHLIYGWVFFGVVIFIMFFIGSFWRDDKVSPVTLLPAIHAGDMPSASLRSGMVVAAAALIMVAVMVKGQDDQASVDLAALPELSVATPAGWQVTGGEAWKPDFHGMDREFSAIYTNGAGERVGLYIGYYAWQRQGGELGNFNNVLVNEENRAWRLSAQDPFALELPAGGVKVPTALLTSDLERLAAGYFYRMGGELLSNKYQTKLVQARVKLMGESDAGSIVVISTPYRQGSSAHVELLQRFYREMALPIDQAFERLSDE